MSLKSLLRQYGLFRNEQPYCSKCIYGSLSPESEQCCFSSRAAEKLPTEDKKSGMIGATRHYNTIKKPPEKCDYFWNLPFLLKIRPDPFRHYRIHST